MSKAITCLLRIGDSIKKNKLIDLSGKEEVTIGRSEDTTVCLMSNMISRCHATLRKYDGSWTIKDNKSLNGIHVNDIKLAPLVEHSLKDGDIVQLGVRTSADKPAEFLFKFHESLKVRRVKPNSIKTPNESEAKRLKLESPEGDVEWIPTQPEVGDDQADGPQGTSHNPYRVPDSTWSPFRMYQDKLHKQQEEADAKLKEYENKLTEMQRLLQDKDCAQEEIIQELAKEKRIREEKSRIVEDLRRKEKELQKEMQEKQERLRQENEELAMKMKLELEQQLKEKEINLLSQLESQRQALIQEKQMVEENLQREMARALEEKDKMLEGELLQQKEHLQKVIENKELKQKLLESQLNETKAEKDKQQEQVLRAREDVLANFSEIMETELQCSICSELFVQATSLNCSHSYCALCINQWMKQKKECPVCRSPVTTVMRSIVLDSYIDKMVEHLSEEMKERRKELVKTRKAEQVRFDEQTRANQSVAPAEPAGRGRGRGGRNRRRGGIRGGGRNFGGTREVGAGPATVIFIEDEDTGSRSSELSSGASSQSSLSSQSSEDNDYVRGEYGAFFGGYGRCFTCGSRGHWANGCPYR
ncbi:hypothetical protein CHS0354_007448 [Potamilus streckersoni]|uniref:E3 ubiquitin-protein ligase CHFR n=1 Tax=Potamilus streckersoni TaxID=2493646 RepID=A0AAE0W3L1_9BIVA|nr:hypothetical protein CHS0354_007448 [Potamilus streckersoni]